MSFIGICIYILAIVMATMAWRYTISKRTRTLFPPLRLRIPLNTFAVLAVLLILSANYSVAQAQGNSTQAQLADSAFAKAASAFHVKITYTSMAPNADGHLEAFARGTDNTIWHNYQTAPNGRWTGWMTLPSGHTFNSDPVVGVNANGMLELFARGTDNHIWTTWQNTVGSSTSWAAWVPLSLSSTSQFQGTPSVVQNSDGRLEVVARRSDGTIWHNYQLAPSGSWSSWSEVQVSGPTFHGDPVIAANGDGRLEAFARGSDNNLWHAWEQTSNSSTSWSNWSVVTSSSQFQGTPSVAVNSDGRMEVVARLSDGTIWHTSQVSGGTGWNNWAAVWTSGQTFYGDPTVSANADGHLEIFAVGSDSKLYHTWETVNGSSTSWSRWVLLQSGSTNQFQGTPDVALDASGRLIVNAIGPVGKSAMWINFQNTPNGTWYGWVLLQPNGQFTTASTVPSMERLSSSLAAYLASLGSNAGVVVEDVTHQQTYTYNSTSQFLTASSIKVPIMLTFFAQIESQGRGPTSNEMNLLTTMIENSNNNSASALFSEIGGASGISRFLQQIGVSGLIPDNNAWGYSEITPQAMVDLLTRLQAGTILTAPDRTTALSLMEQVEADQRWGAGDTAPSGATVAMKNGWVPGPDNLWSVNSSGIIITGAETYIISVYTQEQQSLADGQAIVQRVCGDVAAVLK